jgi:hypothetical protein
VAHAQKFDQSISYGNIWRSAEEKPGLFARKVRLPHTARWVTVYRAWESARPDALFRDPFAERLAGEQGEAIAKLMPRQPRSGWPLIVRTHLIDELILSSIADGCDCVINLAAGLDTRPDRMALPPSLQWIEVSGKGLARYLAARFQPLPIGTAREVFPQAARPVSLLDRVMGRFGYGNGFHGSRPKPGSGWISQSQYKPSTS